MSRKVRLPVPVVALAVLVPIALALATLAIRRETATVAAELVRPEAHARYGEGLVHLLAPPSPRPAPQPLGGDTGARRVHGWIAFHGAAQAQAEARAIVARGEAQVCLACTVEDAAACHADEPEGSTLCLAAGAPRGDPSASWPKACGDLRRPFAVLVHCVDGEQPPAELEWRRGCVAEACREAEVSGVPPSVNR